MTKRHTVMALWVALIIGVLCLITYSVSADELKTNRVNCINIDRIRSSTIVDDWTLQLNMHGKKQYEIKFAHRCHGLKMRGVWIHTVYAGRSICPVDVIRVPMYSHMLDFPLNTRVCMIKTIKQIDIK